MSPPPSIDILFAVLVEDDRGRRRTAGAFSGSATDAGAAGATGERRRLLALMLKVGGLPFLAFSAPVLTASLLACRQPSMVRQGTYTATKSAAKRNTA